MTSAVATRDRAARNRATPATGRPATRRAEPRTGGVSLEESILRAWEDLIGEGSAGCPVCGGRLHAAAGCGGCGSALA